MRKQLRWPFPTSDRVLAYRQGRHGPRARRCSAYAQTSFVADPSCSEPIPSCQISGSGYHGRNHTPAYAIVQGAQTYEVSGLNRMGRLVLSRLNTLMYATVPIHWPEKSVSASSYSASKFCLAASLRWDWNCASETCCTLLHCPGSQQDLCQS